MSSRKTNWVVIGGAVLTLCGIAGVPAVLIALVGGYGVINTFGANVTVGILGVLIIVLSFLGSRGYLDSLRPENLPVEETRALLIDAALVAKNRVPQTSHVVTGLKIASHPHDFPVLDRLSHDLQSQYNEVVQAKETLSDKFAAASEWFQATAEGLSISDLDRVWYLQSKGKQ